MFKIITNTGHTIVNIEDTTVYEDGQILLLETLMNYDNYPNAYTTTRGEWEFNDDLNYYIRNNSSSCPYCGKTFTSQEIGYTVTYTDGVEDEDIFEDQVSIIPEGLDTPEFSDLIPTRNGYTFKGWNKLISETVTENVTYTALWELEPQPDPEPEPEEKDVLGDRQENPGTGNHLLLYFEIFGLSIIFFTGIVFYIIKKRCN